MSHFEDMPPPATTTTLNQQPLGQLDANSIPPNQQAPPSYHHQHQNPNLNQHQHQHQQQSGMFMFGSSQQPTHHFVYNHHQVYNPTGGTNFFMHKYDYNPRLLFDNLQNMIEKTAPPFSSSNLSATNPPLGRQSSLDNLSNQIFADQQFQQIDLARIKLEDTSAVNSGVAANNKTAKPANNVIDDLNRIELDSSSVSMLNDVNDELILSIINENSRSLSDQHARKDVNDSNNSM